MKRILKKKLQPIRELCLGLVQNENISIIGLPKEQKGKCDEDAIVKEIISMNIDKIFPDLRNACFPNVVRCTFVSSSDFMPANHEYQCKGLENTELL